MKVWIFADWNPVSVYEITMLRYLRATDVVLGIMGTYGAPTVFNSLLFSQNTDTLKKQGMRVHHMYWLVRDQKRIQKTAEIIHSFNRKCKPDSILFDAEGAWHLTDDASFTPLIAKEYLKEQLAGIDTPMGLTGIAPKLHSTLKPLINLVNYLLPQAYSVWHPTNAGHWSRSTFTEPGIMQHETCTHWKPLLGGKSRELVLGLAGYWLQRPGMSELESMRRCIAAAVSEGIENVAYWSLGNLMHKFPNDVSTDAGERTLFIRNINSTKPEENVVTPLKHFNKHKLPGFVQWLLIKNGKELELDGIWGPKSQKTLEEFRAESGLNLGLNTSYTQEDLDALVQGYIQRKKDDVA